MSFTTLPPELHLQIASYLPTPSLSHLQQTNNYYHNLLLPLLHAHALRPLPTCTSLHNAIAAPHPGLFTLLLDHLSHPLNTPSATGHTPLLTALVHRRKRFFHALLRAGADPHVPTPSGDTPLHMAVLHDDLGAVEALLAAGVDVNATNFIGQSAIFGAVQGASDGTVLEALLGAGANLGVRDWMGGSVLGDAVRAGKGADWVLQRLAREVVRRGSAGAGSVEEVVEETRREVESQDVGFGEGVFW
ncbi:ankyrin repeat-containing domain protein [Tuber indicum]|nr:ankyrin repeat-containing domain protein [Tuber indicum]